MVIHPKRYVLCLVSVSFILCNIQISYMPRQLPQRNIKKPFFSIHSVHSLTLTHSIHLVPVSNLGIMNKCNLPFFLLSLLSFNIILGFCYVCLVLVEKFVCLKNIKLIQIGKFICQSHCFVLGNMNTQKKRQ